MARICLLMGASLLTRETFKAFKREGNAGFVKVIC